MVTIEKESLCFYCPHRLLNHYRRTERDTTGQWWRVAKCRDCGDGEVICLAFPVTDNDEIMSLEDRRVESRSV